MSRDLNYKRLNKKEWLKDMPDLIELLKRDYDFYYSGMYSHIVHISDLMAKKRKAKLYKGHKINLYEDINGTWYLVVYKKYNIDIYFTYDYINSNWNRIHYFINKFKKRYESVTNSEQYE